MSNSLLVEVGNLIKGELADNNDALKAARDARNGTLWRVLCNLICYANNEVFNNGYTKKLARQFKLDLAAETGLSEKQSSKYTEAVSAALGVRGVRKGMRAIEGLPAAAADGVKFVEAYLNAKDVKTFNQFLSAVREDVSPIESVAKALRKLTPMQRTKALELAEKGDAADKDDE